MKITAPKLAPQFGLLIAGPGFHSHETQFLPPQLIPIAKKILAEFKKNALEAKVLYGQNNEDRIKVNLLAGNYFPGCIEAASEISTILNIPLYSVLSGEYVYPDNLKQPTGSIAFGNMIQSHELLNQEILIQEDTLRTYSDILVWLGDVEDTPAKNRDLRLLKETILEGKPVIWFHCDNSIEILDYRLLDEPHRLLLSTTEDSQTPIRSLFISLDESVLCNEIGFIVNPFQAAKTHTKANYALKVLENYFQENEAGKTSLRVAGKIDKTMSAFIRLSGICKALSFKISNPWYGVDVAEEMVETNQHIEEPDGLKKRFEWSDKQANAAAGFHRDITWLLYFFSTLAVFSAVAGAIHFGHPPEWFWPVTELVAILGILVIYGWSSKLDLHGRWLFHRFIAEQIRYTRLGFPLLTFQFPLLAPLRNTVIGKHNHIEARLMSAETWIFKRSIVSAGIPRLRGSQTYQPDSLNLANKNYVIQTIKDQIVYHEKTHHAAHQLEHRLHFFSKLAFILTGLAVAGHFVIHAEWLIIFTAALPALAASIHGIITMNEMGRVSQLSSHTTYQLDQLLKSIERLEKHHCCDAKYFIHLRNLTHESASVMSNVNRQWQDLIQHQQTSLPA